MGRKVILVACGTSIATTAIVVETLQEELVRRRGYDVEFHKCSTSNLLAQMDYLHPNIVITTAPVDPSWMEGVAYFKGLPFLTGVGADELLEEIIQEIEKD